MHFGSDARAGRCNVGFDYVHYHVPKAGFDEIARDHGVKPVGSYKFVMCEHDIVLGQLTQYVFPLIGSSDWTGSLAPDQLSLILGAHVLRTALPPLGQRKKKWRIGTLAGKARDRDDEGAPPREDPSF